MTSGAAFGLTFATLPEWQQRDAVTFSEPADTGPRVEANLSVGNPLDRPVDVHSLACSSSRATRHRTATTG